MDSSKIDSLVLDIGRESRKAIEEAQRYQYIAYNHVEQSQRKWKESERAFTVVTISGVFFNIIVIVSGFMFFRRAISMPLTSLEEMTKELGRGNLTKRSTIQSNLTPILLILPLCLLLKMG